MSGARPLTLERDLEEIVARNADDFERLRGGRIFVTGGTGFVGSWLLESLRWANRRLALDIKSVVLTRDPEAFHIAAPHLAADPHSEFVRGDVRDSLVERGSFDAIVHAATAASEKINLEEPLLMVDTIVGGTRRVLDLAERSGAIPMLLTSSGAVYGPQPPELALLEETYGGAPDTLDPRNAYHESKRLAEVACAIAGKSYGLQTKIARLFAFVGPYLPLDRHFAIGNFIRDGLKGSPVEVLSDGSAVRTYLYAADMASWLWRILLRGAPSRAYNVGSERALSIRDAAQAVAAGFDPPADYVIRGTRSDLKPVARYACSTHRARSELDLAEWTSLGEGIARTIAWHRAG